MSLSLQVVHLRIQYQHCHIGLFVEHKAASETAMSSLSPSSHCVSLWIPAVSTIWTGRSSPKSIQSPCHPASAPQGGIPAMICSCFRSTFTKVLFPNWKGQSSWSGLSEFDLLASSYGLLAHFRIALFYANGYTGLSKSWSFDLVLANSPSWLEIHRLTLDLLPQDDNSVIWGVCPQFL